MYVEVIGVQRVVRLLTLTLRNQQEQTLVQSPARKDPRREIYKRNAYRYDLNHPTQPSTTIQVSGDSVSTHSYCCWTQNDTLPTSLLFSPLYDLWSPDGMLRLKNFVAPTR